MDDNTCIGDSQLTADELELLDRQWDLALENLRLYGVAMEMLEAQHGEVPESAPPEWILSGRTGEELRQAAANHDGEAQHLLAMAACEWELNYYPYDDDRFPDALPWLKKRADAGDALAQYQYARILCYAMDDRRIYEAIGYWMKSAIQGGYALSALELAELYTNEAGWDWVDIFLPDADIGIFWQRLAAKLDSAQAPK